MEIRFDSLKEIKDFILMVDIYQLCECQEEWGGLGYIITNRDYDAESKKEFVVTEPMESRVPKDTVDKAIITPYCKQISWLFKTLYDFVEYNKELDPGSFLDGFCPLCKGYFLMNPEHSAKELMLFVIDGLKRIADSNRTENSDDK